MKDREWRNINLEMKEFIYRLSKLTNPYVKQEAKTRIFAGFEKIMINRSKRIKLKD